MWKRRALTLCGSLAMLPLVTGCSNGGGGPPQTYDPSAGSGSYSPAQAYMPAPPAMAVAADTGGARVYAAGPGAPAAIVVVFPGPGDLATANPQLSAAQGFDVVTPTPLQISEMAAAQQAAAARLIAEAQAMADAPIWLVGQNPAIDAAMPRGGPGQVTGAVVTLTSSGSGTCSERMVYSYSGNGAPKVSVSKSGDACPPGAPFGGGANSVIAPAVPPAVPPHAPRLIETSLPAPAGSPAAQRVAVQRIANLIKSPPS